MNGGTNNSTDGSGNDSKDVTPQEDAIDKDVKKKVVTFLRELADKLEADQLSNDATLHISQFFMKFCFIDALSKGDDTPESEEMVKFLSLGWYIYNFLMDDSQ